MGEPAEYECLNPECLNYAFDPGLCSGCGSELEPVEMIGTEESLEGWPCSAGFAPRIDPQSLQLARDAVRGTEARKNEDVQAWAERLVRDVGHLND